VGYECAAFVDRDYDLSLLERSVRGGTCTLVVEKSRAADAVEQELAAVRSALRSKALHAVLVPVGQWQKDTGTMAATAAGPGTAVGLDLPTEWLAAATTDDVDKLLATLGSGSVGLLSVATNAFTHRHAARVFAWATAAGVPTVATELLRCHPRRPGLLSVAGGRQKLTHLDPTAEGFTMNRTPGAAAAAPSSSASTGDDGASHAQVAAVEAVKHALNACVHAEKQFLERFQQDAAGVDSQAVCWGHILSHTQHTILYPEEWDYVYTQQVQPRLSDALDRLKSQGRAQHEWTLLYGPLAKHLFASFTAALEARRLALCADTHAALRSTSSGGGTGSLRTLPWALAGAALSLGSPHAALAGTDLAAGGDDACRAQADSGRRDAAAAYEDVHRVLTAFASSE